MKSTITTEIYRELKITEGKRTMEFYFKDSKMTDTKQSMPYLKSKADWKFYAKAILEMLKKSKDFYKDPEPLLDIVKVELVKHANRKASITKDTGLDNIPF